jgi:hypothetical protein
LVPFRGIADYRVHFMGASFASNRSERDMNMTQLLWVGLFLLIGYYIGQMMPGLLPRLPISA